MSTEDVNKEDTDMVESEEEKVVTMMDVLQEQQEFEDDVNAVLGASDDKNCTYIKGYIKRQAIYACLTCCAEAKSDPTKRAGVCLACSLSCHENHELIELYTKRNFRCDCGNPKFNSHPCQFTPEKPEINEDNNYNQNFSGLYCTCHRPYPDPEATIEDEMIQCIICEDWLHAAHLETSLPTCEYAEMVCKACMEKNEFLHDYSDIAVNNETEDLDVLTVNEADTSVGNNIGELNGVHGKVNGAVDENNKKDVDVAETNIAIDKVESVATENNKDGAKSEEVADTTAEDKLDNITSEKSADRNENPDNSNKEDQPSDNYKFEENAESNDSPSISSTNDNTETKADNVDTNKEIDENKNKETAFAENQKEPDEQNNDNSIIESIEKLECELGNVATEEKAETKVAEQSHTESNTKVEEKDKEPPLSESISTVENIVCGDSIVHDTASENIESDSKGESTEQNKEKNCESQGNDVEMNEAINSDKVVSENKENVESKTNDVKMNEAINSDKVVSENKEENVESKANDVEMNEAINSDKLESETNFSDKNVEEDIASETVKNLSYEKTSDLNGSETKAEENTKDIKRKLSTEDSEDVTFKKPKLERCARPKAMKRKFKGATFWPSDFRLKLCTCSECISMYKDLSVLFLTDPEDTVTAYEALGKEKVDGTATSQYERGLEALSSLDRIQQINALTEYNKMRDKLLDFLKSFKERREIVKEEDIKAFFAGMKPKRESDGVYFCR